ncbi:MAG: dicarboxylate/amino acid:cation symporter [Bryobacteraceae bacterium]
MRFLNPATLPKWMLASLALGLGFGLLFPDLSRPLAPIAEIFLRLLRAIIAPLLFGILVTALASSGDLRALGRLGLRAAIFFEAATTVALLLGWGVISILRPGDGVALHTAAAPPAAGTPPSVASIIVNAFPTSILDAMARGDVLQIVVFCLLFGAAAAAIGEKAGPLLRFAESIAAVSFQFTRFLMYLAPAAIFAAIASTTAENGLQVLSGLGRFVAASWLAQLAYVALVLTPLLLAAGANLRRFWAYAREPFLIAFGTTSSAAAIPSALENMEAYGVPRRILGFVMPVGLSFNLAGSTIHLVMATFFVAQAGGVALTMTQQLLILLTLKLTSKGVAGIPRANFVILAGLFESFQLPREGLALLLGVDAIIDMVRTGVNVLGHCAGPVVLAKWEERDGPVVTGPE